ncbi:MULTISPECIES: YafY family protein [unclassified Microbacterium]|uniref:helix-turn-helix transcriptional regulator n=1 Tax=unclassified Microbacterium TaxID=2609290 RepID=UPI000CFD8F19|nr:MULTISPECIES: WYL domain-containing protein [unclassified Microbacterium]PRB09507.1 WYL domain-containing protein [Microbacterium sp. MYb72]
MNAQPKPLLAAERVRLYLTLVPYLLEHGQVSLDEAAAEFGVGRDEMRAMVEKLTVIGLPGDSGYWQQPQEMFDINWDLLDDEDIIEITNDVALRRVPRFTAREAAALLAGLQMVAAVPAVSDTGLVKGLISKLSRGAADAPAEVVVAPSAVDEVREVVARGVQDGVAVSFTYQAPDATPTTRTVDPVQILITNAQWYLQGWCHLRQAMRTFHLDRVSDPHLTDIPITHGGDHLPEAFSTAADEGEVTVRVPERVAPLLGAFLSADNVVADAGLVTAQLHLADPRSIKRLAARFGGALEVIDPGVARCATREWAAAGLALYHQPADGFAR